MTSATYRVTLTDRLGHRYGILPPYGPTPIQFSTVINGGGSATVTPKLTLPLISGPQNRARLSAWASEIVIERLTGPGLTGVVWEGPVTAPKADLDSDSLTVSASTPWAWLDERDIDTRQVFAARDQLDVARELIKAYTADRGPEWDIRLDLGGGASGVHVSEVFSPTDAKTVSGAVVDLASATNGFDFDVTSAVDPASGRTRRLWTPYYPAKGRKLTQRLTKGRGGLRAFSIQEAQQIATRVRGSGGELGSYVAQASSTTEARYGVHSRAIPLTSSNSRLKLRAQVDDYLRYRSPPADIVSFQYVVTDATPFGFIQTGDTVPVLAERGWASYDADVRVIGTSTSVDINGRELVTCTAAGVPGGLT